MKLYALDFEASLDLSQIMASKGHYLVRNDSFCRNIFFLISYVRIISWYYAQLGSIDTISAAASTKSTNHSAMTNAPPTLFYLIAAVVRSVSHNWLLAFHVQLSKWAPWSLARSHNSQLTHDLIKTATSRTHAAQSFFPVVSAAAFFCLHSFIKTWNEVKCIVYYRNTVDCFEIFWNAHC